MRKLVLVVFAVAGLVALPAASAATSTVKITASGFLPATVTIHKNDSVTWTNSDTKTHQIASDTGNFQSPVLQPGQTYTYRFTNSGTYGYHGVQNPALKGTVIVQGTSITIHAAHRTIVFGSKVQLSGTLSSGKSGQHVQIRQRGCNADTWQPILSVLTAAGGSWTTTVSPAEETDFQAISGGAAQTAKVLVRPRLSLRRLARGSFHLDAFAFATSYVGKYTLIQRQTSHGWVTVKKVTFKTLRARSHQVRLSQVNFHAKLRSGLRIRAYLPLTQAGVCYVAGWSKTIHS